MSSAVELRAQGPFGIPPLLARLVDDAALFPPGNAAMPDAVREHLAGRAGRRAGVIGLFLCTASRLPELITELIKAKPASPIGLSLVVDTGLHAMKWSRQQAVDYFHESSSQPEPEVQSETDRYMAWPAQALGYKIGQLKIRELRGLAEKQLGTRFDVRAFHDAILEQGAEPLSFLETHMNGWIAAQSGK